MPTEIEYQGQTVPVFVCLSNDMVDAQVRALDRQTFEAAAVQMGLLVEETDEGGNTFLRPASGVNLDHIGPVMLTPGEYDEEGNEIVAPTFDSRHHVNMRLVGVAAETDKWQPWAVEWTLNGSLDPATNASEDARVLADVALIDPDTIRSPVREWA